ncbi:ATP-binding cassette domain-containing protein [Dictyobacter formicarum]|uniref:UvrABC system protein A n=1 Tax=Dictyobacter formicarum TaxID=2778368 RepID=A0ABQ3VSR1_9CHLR|nr:excinuclease ABC subunit UvrA [Dictyobacter formicarum]GHO88674.1 excinuclease ABC subunit A [Dictyobacter formicarum]
MYGSIEVRGARENNLKSISLDIPKRKITVFTGVSGSGKSSLVFGTIAAESQRLLNETFTAFIQGFLPRYGQPDVDSLQNLSTAIVIDQKRLGGNVRSTIGTVTDTYTLLRLLYARLGQPHIGHSSMFSFNEPQGMCPDCEGLGQVSTIDIDALVDREKSLNDGAIRFPTFAIGTWFWTIFVQSGFFDPDKKLRDYSEDEWEKFVNGEETKIKLKSVVGTMNSTYEGLVPKFKRLYLTKDVEQMASHMRVPFEAIVSRADCMLCHGTRLNQAALSCLIKGKNIAECAAMEVSELVQFIRSIGEPTVAPLVSSLAEKLDHLVDIGLGYLSLNRESSTLSGGESQRVRMVRHLGSSLTDVTYVFDEPSIGLHPQDIHRLNELMQQLRDKGNTVLVVEHKPAVIAIADHIVDMGPGAGRSGGEIVYEGSLAGLLAADTLTGKHMHNRQPFKANPRIPTGTLSIEHATLHNLRDVSVNIPMGVLTVVTGVAGSGKSSLMQEVLPQRHPGVVSIDQGLIRGSRRSNLATYTGMLDVIRKRFASENKVSAALFSANSKGACPECQGLGLIYTDLAFMDPMISTCEVCGGKRFTSEVLAYTLRGKSISDVLEMTVVEAKEFFTDPPLTKMLTALEDVGLGYVTLWQPLSTLSGGERQRLKLAIELGNVSQVYVLDEPTTGLHMNDVDNLIALLDRLVDSGSTVIVIEHNLDVIARADWIIDMGPGAGHEGGQIVFEGTVAQLVNATRSVTGQYLKRTMIERNNSAPQPVIQR